MWIKNNIIAWCSVQCAELRAKAVGVVTSYWAVHLATMVMGM